jgi:hypothetical protein
MEHAPSHHHPSESWISDVNGCTWKCISQIHGGFAFPSGPLPLPLPSPPLPPPPSPWRVPRAFLSSPGSTSIPVPPLKRQAARRFEIQISTQIDHASKRPGAALPGPSRSPGPSRFPRLGPSTRPRGSPRECLGAPPSCQTAADFPECNTCPSPRPNPNPSPNPSSTPNPKSKSNSESGTVCACAAVVAALDPARAERKRSRLSNPRLIFPTGPRSIPLHSTPPNSLQSIPVTPIQFN